MSKCFITKLPSSVDNDNLPVLGQLKINWLKQNNLTDNYARAIGLSTNDNITVKVSGAHLTDNTLSSNLGNSKTITKNNGLVWLYVSNDADAVLTIDNKYSLIELDFVANYNDGSARSVYFDIEDIKYCTNLSTLSLPRTQVSGDLNAISNLVNLTILKLDGTNISGDISAVKNLTNLTNLHLSSTHYNGDISALSNLTKLKELFMWNAPVSGDISALSNLINLTSLELPNTNVSGDISALSNLTKLKDLMLSKTNISGDVAGLANLTNIRELRYLGGLSLTGDMSKIPANVYFIGQNDRKVNTNFTWTAKGRQNATFLAMEGYIPFDTVSMDNMFIDQATCTFRGTSDPTTKRMALWGTRTSASDAAVTAIQNMGVTITGVTKQA